MYPKNNSALYGIFLLIGMLMTSCVTKVTVEEIPPGGIPIEQQVPPSAVDQF